jgi:hypothetical protein
MNTDMKKQTAVEWLINELKLNDTIEKENLIIVRQIIEQAKAMEKEQIIEAHGIKREHDIQMGLDFWKIKYGEAYYNETFGGDK